MNYFDASAPALDAIDELINLVIDSDDITMDVLTDLRVAQNALFRARNIAFKASL